MHAVIVQVEVDQSREEETRRLLREVVVARAKQLAGFSGGHWMRSVNDGRGISVLLFESEEAAKAAAEQIRSEGPPPGMPVTFRSAEPFEVVVSA